MTAYPKPVDLIEALTIAAIVVAIIAVVLLLWGRPAGAKIPACLNVHQGTAAPPVKRTFFELYSQIV